MKRITPEQLKRCSYRKAILHNRLQELEDNISGYGTEYLPLITGDDGKIVPEKLNAFINDMLESLDHYIELFPERTLDPETREMYRKYLYCAVSTLQYKWQINGWQTDISKTFGDIIERATDIDIDECDDYHDFLMLQYRLHLDPNIRIGSDFFSSVHESMEFLGGDYAELLPRETRVELCREYARANNISEEDNAAEMRWAEDPERCSKEQEEREQSRPADDVASSEEEQARWEKEMAEEYEKEQSEKQPYLDAVRSLGEDQLHTDNELLKNLSEAEVKSYKNLAEFDDFLDNVIPALLDKIIIDPWEFFENLDGFAKLYFDSFRPGHPHDDFVEDVKNMVETYMYEHSVSAFSFGDYYGLITHQVKRAKKRVEYEIERVRDKYDV